MKIQRQLDVQRYESRGFFRHYQELIREVVIPYQYRILNDQVEGAEKSHAIQNFVNAGKSLRGDHEHDGFYGMVFQDSDVAKWLEAVAFSLSVFRDEELEKRADEVIDIVASAQDSDGYLNTYYTIKDRDKRWTNLLEGHEMYCAGHMMEAGVAYYEATGKTALLDVVRKNADHIYQKFIVEKTPGYPGHPEVELALLKLYRATGEKRYLELAGHFINVRGVDPHFYEKEAEARNWTVWGNDPKDHAYQQSDAPVRQQKDATGHSVRAVYLYTAMADLAAELGDEELYEACKRLWHSITQKRMYVTGGIGSTNLGEAFTKDYHLPNDTAYAETCASIGLMFFASRMLEKEVKGEYADIMERAFYNTVLAGIQLDGKRFFYVNPLEVLPGISGEAVTHKHDLPQRPQWYACACCPPNVARTINSIAKYAYGENENWAYCHMIAEGATKFSNGLEILCKTEYPYEMKVVYQVEKGQGNLAVHIPGWSKETKASLRGADCTERIRDGYLYLENLRQGDTLEILLDERIRRVYCCTDVAENSGKAALQRGPLVYCVEGADNEGDVLSLELKENGEIRVLPFDKTLLCGTRPIAAQGYRVEAQGELYSEEKPRRIPCEIKAVPYYTWGNRGLNQMRVWMPERS